MIADIKKKINHFLYDIVRRENYPRPDPLKIETIKEYSRRYPQCRTFIETGTYFGSTPFALKDTFTSLYTIELDAWLSGKARTRLAEYSNIHCLAGDSSEVLPMILSTLNEPILYWLDGHYSGGITAIGEDEETPIIQELETIGNHRFASRSVILIDDARCFELNPAYPSISLIWHMFPEMKISVTDDIIRVVGA